MEGSRSIFDPPLPGSSFSSRMGNPSFAATTEWPHSCLMVSTVDFGKLLYVHSSPNSLVGFTMLRILARSIGGPGGWLAATILLRFSLPGFQLAKNAAEDAGTLDILKHRRVEGRLSKC